MNLAQIERSQQQRLKDEFQILINRYTSCRAGSSRNDALEAIKAFKDKHSEYDVQGHIQGKVE